METQNPASINITVDHRRNTEIPVQVKWTGTRSENYLYDTENHTLDYEMVTIVGPAEVADQIKMAVIEVDLTNQVESISESYRYTLCDEEGNPVDVALVTTDVAEVYMQLKVQRYKELDLTLKTNYGGGATAENTTITIEPATIRVAGSDALLEKLDEIILGMVDLSSIEEDTEQTYVITLPEGVSNLTGITNATVKIQFKDLTIKEFEVNQIHATNVPEGMEYELMNQVIKVRLRGKTELINAIEPEDILITVDFKGKELGTFTIKPGIRVKGEKFASVGAVGTYSLSVTLKEAEEAE
jgi:YbbR domain-containing protein